MDTKEFRQRGKEMVDFIADYVDTIRERQVYHSVQPGYLRELVPQSAPDKGESWDAIMADVERVIMPGMMHWRSPRFHGFFAGGGSFPSLMGDMLCDAFSCIGFSWAASPACTEMEMLTTDWLGEMVGLPSTFLHCGQGPGGGVIQHAASESVFLCVLAARNKKVKEVKQERPGLTSLEIISNLVCYCSVQANSSVHRAGLLAEVNMREIPLNDDFAMDVEVLRKTIDNDKANGLIPFFLCATLGTTATCAFDDLSKIGPICGEENIWLHVDAAYAGASFVCPEFRHFLKGVEYAQTVSINPHKWMLVHFDCSAMWIQNSSYLVDAFNVDPIYLKHAQQGQVPDYRHWQFALGRRFRSLKLWFVLRSYGVEGIQKYIREQVSRAHQFEELCLRDGRFEVPIKVTMSLVCFRLKGPNSLSKALHDEIISDRTIFLIPGSATVHGQDIYFLRFAIVPDSVTEEDIKNSFMVVSDCATRLLQRWSSPSKPPTFPSGIKLSTSEDHSSDQTVNGDPPLEEIKESLKMFKEKYDEALHLSPENAE